MSDRTRCYVFTLIILLLPFRHPTEPQCSYDPVEGLPIAPDVDPGEKIRMLEEQICTLFARPT